MYSFWLSGCSLSFSLFLKPVPVTSLPSLSGVKLQLQKQEAQAPQATSSDQEKSLGQIVHHFLCKKRERERAIIPSETGLKTLLYFDWAVFIPP